MNHNEMISKAEELFRSLELTELALRDGEFSIELKKLPTASVGGVSAAPVAAAPLSPAAQTAEKSAEVAAPEKPAPETESGICVKAPLLGVFYSASSPDAAPFVKVGDTVKKGDILCIIEAMKMMNEIVAEEDGTVSEILAENGQMVEFGQTLFKLTR